MAIDHHKTNRLLSEIVGGFNSRRRDELQVTVAVFLKAVGKVVGFRCLRNLPIHSVRQLARRFVQSRLKFLVREFFAAMNHMKHLPGRFQNALSVGAILFVGMIDQNFYIADEVGQAELHQHVVVQPHVFAVGTEIVAAQHAVEFLTKNFQQHIRAARSVDFEQRKQRRAKAPRPHAFSVVFVAGLVNVQNRLLRQLFQKLLIHRAETVADFATYLAELPAADLDADNIAKEFADRGERTMASALHIGNQRRQSWPGQTGPTNVLRKGGHK